MCYGIRISSPFHLATQIISIQNPNCPKNGKNACADMISEQNVDSEIFSVAVVIPVVFLTCLFNQTCSILISVMNNIHLYHSFGWINHQHTDCATALLTSNMQWWHSSSFTSKSWDENHVCACVFLRFGGSFDSEWIWFEWLNETGSKFWFRKTCEKVKSNF